MGQFGFSYVGLIFIMMLMIPNLIWSKHQPEGYDSSGENKVLLFFERIGQVCVTFFALCFKDTNINTISLRSLWLLGAFLLMVMYECWWFRYFRSSRKLKDFYSSFLGVPLAGATLPVAAFILLGIYGKLIWLVISTIFFGVGHIGIHIQHKKQIEQ